MKTASHLKLLSAALFCFVTVATGCSQVTDVTVAQSGLCAPTTLEVVTTMADYQPTPEDLAALAKVINSGKGSMPPGQISTGPYVDDPCVPTFPPDTEPPYDTTPDIATMVRKLLGANCIRDTNDDLQCPSTSTPTIASSTLTTIGTTTSTPTVASSTSSSTSTESERV
jgi:hypothetical protein